MIGISALWILILLSAGGFALDRVLSSAITRNFDSQLDYVLSALIASAEIGPDGEVFLNRAPADQRFLEPYSGLYYQITGDQSRPADERAMQDLPSRSLWDRRLQAGRAHRDSDVHIYDSTEFAPETLRILERDVLIPGSPVRWRFQVAQGREGLDEQIAVLRRTMVRSFAVLGLGLVILGALQAFYGLWPLRRVRKAIADIKSGEKSRVDARLPSEIAPLADELNDLLAHVDVQAEEARRHAGNLAHALKTPLTVITNAATAHSPDLAATVIREAATMRRQVDHHLARARAIGRRAAAQSRAEVWPSLEAVERAVDRLYEHVTIDLAGDKDSAVRVERQDLDEILGNLIENAAKYGGGRVFVTVKDAPEYVEIEIEDDGPGIPEGERGSIFERGARLDTEKPGTGLGLAIVRDVAQIYGGAVTLEESEDLGGLLVRLKLPLAPVSAG
ncbi:sensor histidine kinase N-terminal domain-containing protein [Allosphingosinicella flava]|uniref:histidine kinase n=1 Tax=Allosphingosinicella flava TaxID=2771430 RepID=A0A7T2GM11_9SPHN|nr:HAMP domain-containing sensor histidine kinase [Sphingosinicella flava]QPQ56341.1 sensor histidine kinase N-terminal domain-containing protein [Sphingosinicella flava]